MRYVDLKTKYEIKEIITSLKREVSNLSRIILPSEYETTMKGLKILTVYNKFDPVLKIEGTLELIDLFRKSLGLEQRNYISKN